MQLFEITALFEMRLRPELIALFLRATPLTTADAAIEAMRQGLSAMKHPRFALNPQSDAADARLIVLDEVSMVGEEMARDLMSFGKPILVLGDPGQLPPIRGEGAFTRDEPDVMLTEIHRQAAESAIIRLATMAREGRPIRFGVYDDHVAKLRKGDITPEQALRGGQLICGLNATRLQINNAMRAAAGLGGTWLPTGPAEKIICLKNQNDLGLINGMFVTLEDIVDEMVATDSWGEAVETNRWVVNPAEGEEFEDFVASEQKRINELMKELGLV